MLLYEVYIYVLRNTPFLSFIRNIHMSKSQFSDAHYLLKKNLFLAINVKYMLTWLKHS